MNVHATITRYVGLVLAHRWVVLAGVLLFTLAAVAVLPRARVASSMSTMFFDDGHAGFARYQERIRQFGSDEVIAVAVDADDPLSAENIARLEAVHAQIEAIDDVARVTSIATFERVRREGDAIEVRRFADYARDHPEHRAALADEIRGDPAVGGLLLSRDSDAFLVLIELTAAERPAERGPEIVGEVREAFATAGYRAGALHAGGSPVLLSSIVDQSFKNLTRLFPIVIALLLLAVYLMFGRLWPVVVNSISALLAVLWAMAFSILRDPNLNIFMTIVPALVLVISFSDVVHLCSAYLLELDRHGDKRRAIVEATADVGAACFLTSLTTAVGFISMTFIPSPVFRQLGAVAAFGVAVAYALAMTLVPVLLDLFPAPSSWRSGRLGGVQRGLDRLLDGCARLSTTHPGKIIAAFAVLIAVAAAGVVQIHFETDFEKRLAPDNAVRRDAGFIDDHFVSTTAIDLYVEGAEDGAILEAERFNRLAALEAQIEADDQVDKALSVVDYVRATHAALAAPEAELLPISGPALAQIFVLLEMQGPEAMAPVIDFARRKTRLTVYTTESGIRGQDELRRRLVATAAATMGPQVRVDASSLGALMGSWVDDIIAGQRNGLGFSLLVIALILALGFRSVRAGLWSMVPNVLPLVALGGWVGWLWDAVDTDTLIVGMVALGIGVDDTIHFIARYRLERARSADVGEAVAHTFQFSGRGIVITTFIFVLGFAPLALSEYLPIHIMGTMLPFCFVVAVVADLLLVPAMIQVGLLDFPSRDDAAVG